jgi:Peptidase family M1 domain
MSGKLHHQLEHEGKQSCFSCHSFLRVLCGELFCILAVVSLLAVTTLAQSETRQAAPETRLRYQIKLSLDFENRSYSGTERVRWVNRGTRGTSTLLFHLYSNVRVGDTPLRQMHGAKEPADEPELEILGVKDADSDVNLSHSIEDQGTTLRVNLREPVAPKASTEIVIKFKGNVPEIDPEETGLVTHVMQQVSAAIGSTREVRRPRDVNFRCRGVMFLGSAYPVLVARDGDEWSRKIESSIGDTLVTDVADYKVTVDAPQNISLYTAVLGQSFAEKENRVSTTFTAENLRDFAIVAGTGMRAEHRTVGDVTVRSIFRAEHEVAARRALNIAADAVRVYTSRIGPLPIKTLSLIDAPLVATLSSAEFSGFSAIASAFYVDFDSPTVRNMPDLIREQRASVEESLEWTVAHVIAHQWWGATVGNDAGREPVLDEALANWSALLYYREVYGEERAATALDEQLRGVYKLYRTFGGEDMEANRGAKDYRNSFQYAAIVTCKGALMFEALRKLIGDEKFFAALRKYYAANEFEVAEMDDLRGAFVGEAPIEQRRAVSRTFARWLTSKNGDEDISPPDAKLAAELGLPTKIDAKNGRNVFAKVGTFFWRQMTRIR